MIVAFLGIRPWGFQRRHRLIWGWPLAIVVPFGLALGVTAPLPGVHGRCET